VKWQEANSNLVKVSVAIGKSVIGWLLISTPALFVALRS